MGIFDDFELDIQKGTIGTNARGQASDDYCSGGGSNSSVSAGPGTLPSSAEAISKLFCSFYPTVKCTSNYNC